MRPGSSHRPLATVGAFSGQVGVRGCLEHERRCVGISVCRVRGTSTLPQGYLDRVSTTDRDATGTTAATLGEFLDRIAEEASTDEERALAAFARAYTRRLPDDQLASIPGDELRAWSS